MNDKVLLVLGGITFFEGVFFLGLVKDYPMAAVFIIMGTILIAASFRNDKKNELLEIPKKEAKRL